MSSTRREMEGTVERPQDQSPQAITALQLGGAAEEKKKKKKKRKKKKEGFFGKVVQKLVLGSASAVAQMGDAVSSAAKKYRKKHRKSREKRLSGWRDDLGKNAMSAASELIKESAKAPVKLIETIVDGDKKKKKKKKRDEEDRDEGSDGVSVLVRSSTPPTAGAPTPGGS